MTQGKNCSAESLDPVDRIPPTQDALLQHTQRALYQFGIWTTCMQTQQIIPSPQEFSWTKDSASGLWIPM